jgi:hypothetical protein
MRVSKLALPNGDDYPDAAHKHLHDAAALLASNRPDGAAYLSGYVVECALKSLIVLEGSTPPRHHRLDDLRGDVNRLAVVAGAKAARYFGRATQGVVAATISAWNPEMRYRAASMTASRAADWHGEATQVFREIILQMQLDGEI